MLKEKKKKILWLHTACIQMSTLIPGDEDPPRGRAGGSLQFPGPRARIVPAPALADPHSSLRWRMGGVSPSRPPLPCCTAYGLEQGVGRLGERRMDSSEV